jgi:hypothetical protein
MKKRRLACPFRKTGNKNGGMRVVLNEWNRAEPKEESCTTERTLKRREAASRKKWRIIAFEAIDMCCTKA